MHLNVVNPVRISNALIAKLKCFTAATIQAVLRTLLYVEQWVELFASSVEIEGYLYPTIRALCCSMSRD